MNSIDTDLKILDHEILEAKPNNGLSDSHDIPSSILSIMYSKYYVL